jgi:chemotaxis family two-component system response regulator Rcp1
MPPARILVIDDNEADVHLLRDILNQQERDYEVEVLRDGEEALRFVREHRVGIRELEPCVILLDLHLPRHDGIAILRAIRQAPALEHVQVVVLSGLASPHQKVEIADLGAVYRAKPSVLNELTELAAEIIAFCKNSSPAKSFSLQ